MAEVQMDHLMEHFAVATQAKLMANRTAKAAAEDLEVQLVVTAVIMITPYQEEMEEIMAVAVVLAAMELITPTFTLAACIHLVRGIHKVLDLMVVLEEKLQFVSYGPDVHANSQQPM
jgi:hypothetical protein